MPSRIAVIGGGPKAAAIASKASALREAGFSAPVVTIYEQNEVGSAWTGRNGYSNGDAELCTTPLRDVGFPYSHAPWGSRVTEFMAETYSWPRFLASTRTAYAEWVDGNQPFPTHARFAHYLAWVVERSRVPVEQVRVNRISRTARGAWAVERADGRPGPDYDGIVVTGSGPPLRALPGADADVLNGHDVWRRRSWIAARVTGKDARIIIIGAGGTAAAAANWLLEQGFTTCPILIVGRPATLFTRTPSAFENRIFGNDEVWDTLTDDQQAEFVKRLNSGVVWDRVGERLGRAANVQYHAGDALSFHRRGSELRLEIRQRAAQNVVLPASVFIDCRGFDAWWFGELLNAADQATLRAWRASTPLAIDRQFALSGAFPHPGLHVPGIGSSIGPAAGNLMALGWVADAILQAYLPDEEVRFGAPLF